jgi:hypothetical protein
MLNCRLTFNDELERILEELVERFYATACLFGKCIENAE